MNVNIFVQKIRIMWALLAITVSTLIVLIESLYRNSFDIVSFYIAITVLALFVLFGLKLNRLLQLEGMYDSLTEIGNRKKFIYDLDRFSKSHKSFAICYIDVDNFKGINDKYGHNAGDEYLITLASNLKNFETKEIMVYRVGGDEFVCILLNINEKDSFIYNVNKIIGNEVTFKDGKKDKIAFSVGFALNNGDLTPNEVLEIADKSMYLNKTKK